MQKRRQKKIHKDAFKRFFSNFMITIFISKFVLNFNRKTLPTLWPPVARLLPVFIPRVFSYLNNYLSEENIFSFLGGSETLIFV